MRPYPEVTAVDCPEGSHLSGRERDELTFSLPRSHVSFRLQVDYELVRPLVIRIVFDKAPSPK